MKNILFAAALVAVLALAACSSDNQTASDEGTNSDSQSETSQNEQQDKNAKQDKQEEDKKNENTTDSKEAPAQYQVFIEKTKFKFKQQKKEDVHFKVSKNGEPFSGGELGLLIKLPIGDLPYQVEKLKNGKFVSKVQVPESGVYDAKVFKMEDNERKILGQFRLSFEK
ncbi:hypothetical protein [Virgibacillus siamensis]|uniref:hypothetical protein n=1 Tax=Virgibacillus siamensis TaxID=480071 RepID=UPI0009861D1D|nr:hypothetical protein [Virgibacillus siamensis]